MPTGTCCRLESIQDHSFCLTELSDHEPDRRSAQEGEGVAVQALPVLRQPAAAVQPGDGALDDPALWQHNEPPDIGAPDDLDVYLAAGQRQPLLEFRPLIAAVGVQRQRERKQKQRKRRAADLLALFERC